MKFKDLPAAARFCWQGKKWTRDGPISAVATDGTRRVIPRWAVVEPLEVEPPTTGSDTWQPPHREALEQAIDTYEARVAQIVAEVALRFDEAEAARLRRMLEESGRALRRRLALEP